MLNASLQSDLDKHAQSQLTRQRYRIDEQAGVTFCSNDYLGLSIEPELKKTLQLAVEQDGIGSGASQLISGHHSAHANLENALAEFLKVPRVLMFSTGFMANLAVLTTLTQKSDCVIEDKLNHASLIDGGRFSEANFKRFRHVDLGHCERLLQAKTRQTFLVSDGVFSMDGDLADVAGLQALAEKYHASVMIDDAHGIGVLGKTGRGVFEQTNCRLRQQDILSATFGKAFGGFGAFVAGSEEMIEHLIQFARPYIYTTALPPAYAAAMHVSLKIIESQHWRREQLNDRIQFFKQKAHERALPLRDSITPIQPIMLGSAELALRVASELRAKGFFVTAIRPPTVAQGQSRLRITLNVHHSHHQIESLIDALSESLAQ